ncbi:MAG TPA: CocE/NonD family hydrolase [Nitriliruptorales bacterium]
MRRPPDDGGDVAVDDAVDVGVDVGVDAGPPGVRVTQVSVPLRDGVGLLARVYQPATLAPPFPAVVVRTPYSIDVSEFDRLGWDAYLDLGVAVVHQLVRGQGGSGGSFDFFWQEGRDGYDTVEWVAAQAWCDGRVGMDGGSYLGTAQYLAALESPPHLRCIMPTVPAGDLFDELPRIGGALHLGFLFEWIPSLAPTGSAGPGPDAVTGPFDEGSGRLTARPLSEVLRRHGIGGPLVDEVLRSDTLTGRWCEIQLTDDDHERVSRIPILTVTGWADGDQAGGLYHWAGIQRRAAATAPVHLIIGPWMHQQCYLGGEPSLHELEFGPQSVLDIRAERVAFLRRHLLDDPSGAVPPRARVFVTGSNRWRADACYPPADVQPTPLYLRSDGGARTASGDGRLSAASPADERPDRFAFDPTDPFPYAMYGVDVREAEDRPDVLIYTSAPAHEDVEIVGDIWLSLHAATDGGDTDWAARLVDVTPDGRAVNLSHGRGYLRARYREGFDRTVRVEPGAAHAYRIRLQDVGHTFLRGHRVRLELTSSMFPLADPNPNTGTDPVTESAVRTAQQTVFHDRDHPSHLMLPVTRGSFERILT